MRSLQIKKVLNKYVGQLNTQGDTGILSVDFDMIVNDILLIDQAKKVPSESIDKCNEWLDSLTPHWIDGSGNSQWAINGVQYNAVEAVDYWHNNLRKNRYTKGILCDNEKNKGGG